MGGQFALPRARCRYRLLVSPASGLDSLAACCLAPQCLTAAAGSLSGGPAPRLVQAPPPVGPTLLGEVGLEPSAGCECVGANNMARHEFLFTSEGDTCKLICFIRGSRHFKNTCGHSRATEEIPAAGSVDTSAAPLLPAFLNSANSCTADSGTPCSAVSAALISSHASKSASIYVHTDNLSETFLAISWKSACGGECVRIEGRSIKTRANA